jgi:hypothetical protein
MSFFKSREQAGKPSPLWEKAPLGGEGYKEKIKVVEKLCAHV